MGNQCSSVDKNCEIKFDISAKRALAFGNVTQGHFQTDPEIAGRGTVLSLVIPTAIGLGLSLVLIFGLISDRIPKIVTFLDRHSFLRVIVPSPSQISSVTSTTNYNHVIDAPSSSTHAFESSASTLAEHDMDDYSYGNSTPYWEPFSYPSGPYEGSGYQHDMDNIPLTSVTNNARNRQRHDRPSREGRQSMPPKKRPRRNQEPRIYPPASSRPPSTHPTKVIEIVEEKVDYIDRETLSERVYDVLEAILFSIPDGQILLAFALVLSYRVRYGCLMSQYHWSIAFNLCIIGCSNFLLAFTLVRNYWQSPLAGVIRIVLFLTVAGFLGDQVRVQTEAKRIPESVPPNSRNDSAILLNAKCFTDGSIEGPLTNLTDEEAAIVGGYEEVNEPLYLCIVLGVFFAVSLLVRVVQLVRYRTNGPRREQRKPGDVGEEFSLRSYVAFLWWGGTLIACASLYGVAAHRIFGARDWVAASGWVEGDEFSDNPENDIKGFGQIAAMVAAGAFIIAGADRWRVRTVRWR